jgi:D-xylose transport system substrate-binding protein
MIAGRNLLVLLSCGLSVVLGLALRAGGAEGASTGTKDGKAEADQIVIGLSLDTLKEERWQRDRDMFVAEAERLGAKVLVQSANSDDRAQVSDVEKLLTNKVDVLVVVPHDGAAMAKAVTMAHEENTPVMAYDRMIESADLDLYISFDNKRVGALQAEYLVNVLPDHKGKIVRIYGSKTDSNAKLFKAGQDSVLDPLIAKGDIEVVFEDWAENWKPENGKRIMNAAVTSRGKDFAGVLASNDGTAGGAIQALSEEGLAGQKFVTGQDAELVALQRIAAGTQSMTIYKPLKLLAKRAAQLAFDLAKKRIVVANTTVNNGKGDVPSVLLDVVTVTKDNIKETVVADGFHKQEDVYLGVSADAQPKAATP